MPPSALVLVDGPVVARWQRDAIERLRDVADVGVRVSPCGEHGAPERSIARRVVALIAGRSAALRGAAVAAAEPAAPPALVLDLRRCAPHAVPPTHAAVWYFRAAGEADAPFAAAIAAGAESLSVALCERGAGLDRIVAEGRYRCGERYAAAVADALFDAATWPAREWARGPRVRAAAPAAEGPERPGVGTALRFAAVLAGRRVRRLAETLFVDAVWNVGVVDAPPHAFLGPPIAPPTRWFAMSHGTRVWIADPMVASDGERTVVLVERFDRVVGRGTLAALPLDDPDAVPRDIVVRREHLSYPGVLAYDGALYLIPECHESGGVPVYRSTAFPERWELELMMTPAPDLLDPTIFAHGGQWWLFGTRRHDGPNTKLCAWYGPTPLGPWTAHARNPIRTDITGARPAGPVFSRGGALYRPAQDCARSYGAALSIARIDRLTPEEFAETTVARVAPLAGTPYRDGIHTICATPDGRCVVDGKRHVIAPLRPFTALVHRVTRRRAARRAAAAYPAEAAPATGER